MNRVALHKFSPDTTPPSPAHQERASIARSLCDSALSSTLLAHQKLQRFEALWPTVMARLVQNAVQEYADMDTHMKTILDKL